jgi:hypothetical protein
LDGGVAGKGDSLTTNYIIGFVAVLLTYKSVNKDEELCYSS